MKLWLDYKSARDNVHYHRIDERVLCVTLHIFVSLKLPSTGVTTLGPFVSSGHQSKYFNDFMPDFMQLLLPTFTYSIIHIFYCDLCFFPEKFKVFFLFKLFEYFPLLKIRIDDVNCLRLPVSAGKKHYFSDRHLQGQPSKMRKWELAAHQCLALFIISIIIWSALYNANVSQFSPLNSLIFKLLNPFSGFGSEDLLCILWDVLLPWHRAPLLAPAPVKVCYLSSPSSPSRQSGHSDSASRFTGSQPLSCLRWDNERSKVHFLKYI